jgi:hypothetical protein
LFKNATFDENFQLAKTLLVHVHDQLPSDSHIVKCAAFCRLSLSVFKFLIENGANINDSLSSALREMCNAGNLDVFKYLMNYVTNPAMYEQAMYAACNTGNTDLVKLMFDHGAELNDSDAFHDACNSGHTDIVKFMLEHGFDINTINTDGFLFNWNNVGIIDLLINNGLDMLYHGENILRSQAYNKQPENMKILLTKHEFSTYSKDQALFCACCRAFDKEDRECYMEIMKILLENGTVDADGECYRFLTSQIKYSVYDTNLLDFLSKYIDDDYYKTYLADRSYYAEYYCDW